VKSHCFWASLLYNTLVKKLVLPVTLIFLGVLAVFSFQLFGGEIVQQVLNWESVKKLQNLPFIEQVKREVNMPGGLRSERDAPDAYLTRTGVIEWTNSQRVENGLDPLQENSVLNASAQKKLEDMFQKQYFAHDAPDGTTPGDIIEIVGYEYITTGENLALGNFADDQELVQAWMDSPGHRENILKDRYQEIGVAVGKGIFDGEEVWIAVQHFGKPLTSCPGVDESLRTQIDQKTTQAESLQQELDTLKQELENSDPQTEEEAKAHNDKVDEYNTKVAQYNALVQEIKTITTDYNSQVNAFNSCANAE